MEIFRYNSKLFIMKKIYIVLLLMGSISLFASLNTKEMLEIGEALPLADAPMLNVDDQSYTLNSIKEENGLLVIFSCNTCPFVVGNGTKSEGWENRYNEISEWCEKANLGMVLINSNAAKRKDGDSIDDMKERYKDQGFSCYYVLDKNAKVADAFGALTTPHVYLFDGASKLVYRGAIDDNVARKNEVESFYLRDAINNLSAGNTIDPETTRQLGCSIKRK